MIKLATVFSGIGAIEHALYRMNLDHEIVFACDNGEVNIFSKKIPLDPVAIDGELNSLGSQIDGLNAVTYNSDQGPEILRHIELLNAQYSALLNNFVISQPLDIDSNFNSNRKFLKDLAERTSMLFERLNTIKILLKLESFADYSAKKAFVDNLYSAKESSNQVMKSYLANYHISRDDFHWNISFIDGRQYQGMVDLLVGGSPCQSFSLVGKQRGLEDTRGTLFYEFARLIKQIEPKVFIYENVKAVLSNDSGRTWDTMQKVFTELNYNWKMQVLNAKDYGIPQNRERIFVVGFRNDLHLKTDFSFPQPVPLTRKMADFLEDNAPGKYYLPEKGVAFVTDKKNLDKSYTQIDGVIALCQTRNQQFNWHGDFVFVEDSEPLDPQYMKKYYLSPKVEAYVRADGTKDFHCHGATDLDIARPLLQTMHKMHRSGVDNYVTREGHLRKLTPRECLRLMGFSDRFKIVVSDTAMYQQAGNSIVVDVLIAIMNQIMKSYSF